MNIESNKLLNKTRLPNALKKYEQADFGIQQKAKFIYYMMITVLVGLVLLLATSTYLQIIRTENGELFLPALLPIITLVFLIVGCLVLLTKGFYGLSTHLLMVLSILTVWMVMWFDKGHFVARLDTIVIVVALLNLAPLFITNFKSTIFIYIFSNVIMLIVFVWYWNDKMDLPTPITIDYLIDTIVAMVFTGFVGYYIFTINKKTVDRALVEISERRLTEETLKESESFRQRIFDESRISIVIMDAVSFKYLDCNPAAVEIYRFPSREETLGKTPLDVSAPFQYDGTTSVQKAISYIETALNEGSVVFEWRHQRPDGELWDAEVHLMSFQSGQKKFLQFSMVDISVRKRAEKELAESKKLFQDLAQMSPVGIFRTDAKGCTTYVNPKWSELSGFSFNEALGDGWLKAVHPEDREILSENWKIHSSKGEKSTAEYRFVKPDGSIVWVLGETNPEIEDKVIKGYIGTLTDITELKIAEKALKESEETHRKLVEALPDMVMQTDLKGNILYGNEPFEKITGITKNDYNNLDRLSKIHPDDTKMVSDVIKNFLLSDKTHSEIIENRFIDAKGNLHWFSGRCTKLSLNNQIVLQTVTRDITENKKNELELNNYRNHLELLVQQRTDELGSINEELQSTNEELFEQHEELQKSIDKLHEAQQQLIQAEKMASLGILSAGIAHEINNPLNFIHGGILGIESYIKENIPDHSSKVEPLIDAVNTGVKRATAIVSSLSHYSRKDDLPLVECCIHDIIDNSLIMLQNKLKNKVEIKKHYTQENSKVFGNEGKLHQAILNILANAEQAITEKGTIEIETKTHKKNITITIADSGCGINPEILPKIFDPFYTTKDPGKGTGLGLAITYNIVQEHKGIIEYESQIGKGTKVTISLPFNKKIA